MRNSQVELLNGRIAKYYYEGTTTVCLLIEDGKVVTRGVSVCSPLDQFVKKIGRAKALGRAIQALVRGGDVGEMIPFRFDSCQYRLGLEYAWWNFLYKSSYLPKLTEKEKAILGL